MIPLPSPLFLVSTIALVLIVIAFVYGPVIGLAALAGLGLGAGVTYVLDD